MNNIIGPFDQDDFKTMKMLKDTSINLAMQYRDNVCELHATRAA